MWVKPRRSKHPPLPLEIVEQVIRLTDPSTVGGRHSLVAWARVSRACWSVATECLYNHVVVSRKRLRALLNGYKRRTAVSPRAAFVLAAVCRFTMVGPFGNAIASLWDMALRMGCTLDKPMFPNVRQLTLRKAPWGIAGWGGHDGQIPTKCLPQSDECAIFDRPDLCAEDEADWNELLRIPVRGFANVYLHRRGADILGLLPPQGWDQLVFFAIVPFDERHLHEQYRLRMRQSGRTLAILFNTSITTPPRLQPQVVRNVETTDIIQLRWFTPDELDECPCCAVCGERWGKRPDTPSELLQWMPYASWRWHKTSDNIPGLPPHPRLRKTKKNERRIDIAKGYIPRRISYVSAQLAKRLRRTST